MLLDKIYLFLLTTAVLTDLVLSQNAQNAEVKTPDLSEETPSPTIPKPEPTSKEKPQLSQSNLLPKAASTIKPVGQKTDALKVEGNAVLSHFDKEHSKPVPEPKPESVPEAAQEPKTESKSNFIVGQRTKPDLYPSNSLSLDAPKKGATKGKNRTPFSLATSEDPFSQQRFEEDYGDEVETTKPATIDDDAIQELVNKFLNTGEGSEEEKVNKKVLELINSSNYWHFDAAPEHSIKDPAKAKKWLDGYSVEAQKVLAEVANSGWNYFTSISPINKQMLQEAEDMLSQFVKSTSKQARQFDLTTVEDPALRRQIEMLTVEGINALNKTDYQETINLQATINKAIADASICSEGANPPCLLKLVDLATAIEQEKRPATALYIWKAWRDSLKKADLATKYSRLMNLTNMGAKMTGFKDAGAMWRSPFDLSSEIVKPKINLIEEVNRLYEQILPFYKQLHAYFRRQLAAVYKLANSNELTKDGPIPAHVLRNLIKYDWASHYYETRPFKNDNKYSEEITEQLYAKNVTSKKMFIQAYRFFKSLGYPKLPRSFWTYSVFARKWSRDMLCEPPTAYNMRDGISYRIKACAQVGEDGFKLAHKLLAHVHYQYSYRRQPLLFQEAANPSFLSAVTNAFYIVAGNPDYLAHLNVIPSEGSDDQARQINALYLEALNDFVQLPFDIVADTWRFNIYEGKTNKNNWNEDWWKLSEHYQGIKAPIKRNSTDFDAITSSAIARIHSPAIRHFIGYIMQFQVLKTLCPNQSELNKGCFVKSSDVENIKKVMSLGSSITWMEALEMITGSDKLDAKPLLDYYHLLITWLENTNEIDQTIIGWDGPGTPFVESELPSIANNTDENRIVLSADQVAYPGDNCTNGQECLLDSTCKNGVCECNEGLYTLKIGKTHNCVPGNPADAGFGENQGGLVIGLYPKENVTVQPGVSASTPKAEAMPEPAAKTANNFNVSLLLVAIIAFHLFTLIRR